MKFKIKSSEFLKAINSVEGVISIREIKSILSNLKVEAEEGKVSLSATDLEISIKTSLNAECLVPGTTSIPAKQLSNQFKTIHFSDALLETVFENGTSRTIVTDAEGKYDFKMSINGIESEEIKTISKIDPRDIVEFPCYALNEMIKKTSYSVAQEDTRFVFNGLYLLPGNDQITFVGTDGRRLAKISRKFPNLPFNKGIIIPYKAIKEITKMIDSNDTGKIGLIENQVYISIGNVELLCKLIDGNFPDYEQVIPKGTVYSVSIPKNEFQIALRQAITSAEEPSRQVRFKFSKNSLNLNSSTPGSTEVNINIPVNYDGEEMTIAFKGDYVNDVIKVVEDSEIKIDFINSNSPVIFRDPSDPDFVSVIMPMKV